VLAGVAHSHALAVQHKFVFELGWREYFRHVWQHRGDAIAQPLHAGPLPEAAYTPVLPADIREARTGLPVIDQAVCMLYGCGWLHNHARLWLASYVVHMRQVHWRAGADWMLAHLLDGDLASNHLSWQWVAGTGSHRPYLFNAENVARYAPTPWHSPGSVLDASGEHLQAQARRTGGVLPEPGAGQAQGVAEPALLAEPPGPWQAPDAQQVAGRPVWLLHPWALQPPPAELSADTLVLGLWLSEPHRARPWTGQRWAFAGARLQALAPQVWHGSAAAVQQALRTARSVQAMADPHITPLLPRGVAWRAPALLFAPQDRLCGSFSQWWTRATRGVQRLADLPGLAALRAQPAAGPLFEPPSG
jgi:deoxyribodipyrimidine photo-lyase